MGWHKHSSLLYSTQRVNTRERLWGRTKKDSQTLAVRKGRHLSYPCGLLKATDFELKFMLQATEAIDLVEEVNQVDVCRADMFRIGLVVDDTPTRREDNESLMSEQRG